MCVCVSFPAFSFLLPLMGTNWLMPSWTVRRPENGNQQGMKNSGAEWQMEHGGSLSTKTSFMCQSDALVCLTHYYVDFPTTNFILTSPFLILSSFPQQKKSLLTIYSRAPPKGIFKTCSLLSFISAANGPLWGREASLTNLKWHPSLMICFLYVWWFMLFILYHVSCFPGM